MDNQICDKCGGSMSLNPNKTIPIQPDWICNQDKGQCGAPGKKPGSWFATGAWDSTFRSNVQKTKAVAGISPVQQNGSVPAEVWEAKDRMNCMQTAINAASTIHEGIGKIDEALQDALRFYDLLRQAKQGMIQRYKAPQSKVGQKIAAAMEASDPEINVDDIPFN